MHFPLFGIATLLPLSLSLAEEPKSALIWTVSDADSTVYLAGSIHLLREQDMPIPAAFDKVYAESEEVVFEIDMAAMSTPAMVAELRSLGSLPEGETLGDKLSAATMEKLRAYLKTRNLDTGIFDPLTPGMVYLMIASLEASRIGATPELGLETQYFRKSVKDGKPSRGLETAAFQMSRFDAFDAATMDKFLNDALDEIDQDDGTLDSIIGAWRSGDAEELSELMVDQTAPTPKLRKVLLTDRNKDWIPQIEKHLGTDRDVMFLVGAAHLVGVDGVVDLLKKKGYEVLRLANPE